MASEEYKGLYGEQVEIIKHEKGDIMVSASAGSGKTFVMIKRLIRLITEKKARIREILAVTFTEAAAKEMKEKLADAVNEAIKNGNEDLAEEAADLPYADVCTIDAFCARIDRLYFYRAGISPDFSVIDAAGAEKLKNDAINKVFREYYKRGDADFKLLAKRFSKRRTDNELKKIILSCYEFIATEEDTEKFKESNLSYLTEEGLLKTERRYMDIVKRKVIAYRCELTELKEKLLRGGYKKGADKADDLLSVLDGILSISSPYDLKNLTVKLGNFDGKTDEYGLALKKEIDIYKARTEDIRKDAAEFFADEEKDREKLGALYSSTQKFYEIIDKFCETYAELKREENVLDFNDLERFALKALRSEDVKNAVRSKYKYVFIDEYQDVNGIQEAIVGLISKDNTFMVGDVKQSIYGFRGCRSDFFENKFKNMEESGAAARKLNRNFRSSDAVIDAVNRTFSYSMTKNVYVSDYSGAELCRGGKFPEGSGRFGVFRYFADETEVEESSEEKPSLYDVVSATKKENRKISKEARVIAKIIADEMRKTYFDVKTGGVRHVEFGDIALLSRVGAGYSTDLIEGLNKLGVPVSTDGDVSVLSFPEIFTLISLLKVLRNFYDDVSLATVMKSPFGNFTEEELAEIALSYYEKGKKESAAGFSAAVEKASDLSGELTEKLIGFKDFIDKARFLSDFYSAGEILEKIIDDKRYYAFLAATEGGEEKIERVKFFIRKASEGKKYSLGEFINLTETAESAFKTGGGRGGNAVKFVTIHSSKGLEYPVVILRGADKNISSPKDLDDKILSDRESGFALRFYDDGNMSEEETPFTGLIKAKIKENAIPEELRLFYVALTRAKNSLYITFKGKKDENTKGSAYTGLTGFKSAAKSYVNFLPPDTVITDVTEEDLAITASEEIRREVIFPETDRSTAEKMKKEFSFVYPFEEDTVTPLKSSVTAAMQKEETEYVVKSFVYSDDATDTERGNIAHRIMELYDFDSFPDIAEFTDGLVRNGLLTDGEREKVNLDKLRLALNGGAFDVVKNKTLYREKNFIVSAEANRIFDVKTSAPVVLQGKIDLLAIGEDGAYVIDYKYSAHGAKTLKERYAKQLDLYAYAVEKALGVKVKGKYIISLLSGETVKID